MLDRRWVSFWPADPDRAGRWVGARWLSLRSTHPTGSAGKTEPTEAMATNQNRSLKRMIKRQATMNIVECWGIVMSSDQRPRGPVAHSLIGLASGEWNTLSLQRRRTTHQFLTNTCAFPSQHPCHSRHRSVPASCCSACCCPAANRFRSDTKASRNLFQSVFSLSGQRRAALIRQRAGRHDQLIPAST